MGKKRHWTGEADPASQAKPEAALGRRLIRA